MVNMNSSKRARQQDSIKNKPTCGGSKKSGLMRFTGMDSSISFSRFGIKSDTRPVYGMNCPGNFSVKRNQTCAGGVGKHVTMRHCGTGDSTNEAVMKETIDMALTLSEILFGIRGEKGDIGTLIGEGLLLPEEVTEQDINNLQQDIENSSYICSSPSVNENGYIEIGMKELILKETLEGVGPVLFQENGYVSATPTRTKPVWIYNDPIFLMLDGGIPSGQVTYGNPFAQFYLPGIYYIPNGNDLSSRALLFLQQNLVGFCNLQQDEDIFQQNYALSVDAQSYTSSFIEVSGALTQEQYNALWASIDSADEPIYLSPSNNEIFVRLIELMAIAHSIPIYIGDGDEYISAWMLTGGTRAFCKSLYGTDNIANYSNYISNLLYFLLNRDVGEVLEPYTNQSELYKDTDKIKFTLDLNCLQNHLFSVTTDTSSFLTRGGFASSKDISNYCYFGWDPKYNNNTLNPNETCITTSVSTNESEKTLLFSTIKEFRSTVNSIAEVEETAW